jgi:carbamoyl-phosphate synthase large subunit
VELVQAFQRAGEDMGIDLVVHGTDLNRLAPAMHVVDRGHLVPRIDNPDYLPRLIQIAKKYKIDALIPTIDTDLPLLSRARDEFAKVGCDCVISDQRVIDICQDKYLTFETLRDARIDTPNTWTLEEAAALDKHKFPYHMKPRQGSAGKGNYHITNLQELNTFGKREKDPLVQEFVDGVEHTMDVYTGLDGVPRCAVPRRRMEVRFGEVSKGVVVKDQAIMDTGIRVARALGGCRGVVTVQCMVTKRGRIRVIEINPRFGGGAPLGIEAGADFPKWLMTELLGGMPRIQASGFKDQLVMLRYDQSVFIPLKSAEDDRPVRSNRRNP